MTKGFLDEIPGLGPTRRKRLVKELGGVSAVRRASLEQLRALPWLPDARGRGDRGQEHRRRRRSGHAGPAPRRRPLEPRPGAIDVGCRRANRRRIDATRRIGRRPTAGGVDAGGGPGRGRGRADDRLGDRARRLGRPTAGAGLDAELWERHAGLVAGGLHGRGRPRVRGADPPARGRAPRRLPAGCSTSAAARARSPAWRTAAGAELVVGLDPTWAQVRVAVGAGRRPALPARRARRRCRSPTPPSTRSSPASCSSTSTRRRRRPSPRSARVLRARWPVPVLPQPPAAADAQLRLDRRPGPRPARAVLAHRALPGRGPLGRGGGEGRVHPLHPPAPVPLRQRPGRQRPPRDPHGGAGAAAGLPGPGGRVRGRRRRSPACCSCRTEKR